MRCRFTAGSYMGYAIKLLAANFAGDGPREAERKYREPQERRPGPILAA
jgi:hypothetical protein